MNKSVFLKVASAFMVDGILAKAGQIVEVAESEAKNLLQRGKASLATAHDHAKADPKKGESPKEESVPVTIANVDLTDATVLAKPPKKGK